MKQFLQRFWHFLLIGVIPLILLAIAYWYFDPFKVLRSYNNYSYSNVIPNRDYISTEMFMKNYKKYHYNSFIFGSSRTLGFKPASWSKHLSPKDEIFMFDASSESIYGIYTKLKYLDSLNVHIDNALIILCRDVSFEYTGNHQGHLFIKHPATSKESDFDFQLTFFKAYLTPRFLFNFYAYNLLGTYKPYMAGYIENRKITYGVKNNEINIIDQEKEITTQPEHYYSVRKAIFYKKSGEKLDNVQRIKKEHVAILSGIKSILDKNNTKYKVVLSPLYDEIKFNTKDWEILKNMFSNNIMDFSGHNTFTASQTNYYESNHFRPVVGDSVMNLLYK